jgi:polysaccharide pyruvyl transferase WcaK-like protein
LLGWIGKPSNRRTRFLYHLLLPRAQEIIIRDGTSYDIVKQMWYKAKLHHDFAENIIKGGKVEKLKGGKLIKEKYILININKKMLNTKHIHAIHVFCEQYSDCIKIFFPCDMWDDATCYDTLKKTIPDLLYYDRTKKTLAESLSLFHHSRGGIGCRLHFLLPLKIYGKEFEAIPYADKINKLILK